MIVFLAAFFMPITKTDAFKTHGVVTSQKLQTLLFTGTEPSA